MKPIDFIDIAVPVPLRQAFTYRLPEGTVADTLTPGLRFRVKFGRQTLVGIMLDCNPSPTLAQDKIRPALQLLDTVPVLPTALLALCRWAADYYQHPIGEVFSSALPRLLRAGATLDQTDTVLQATADAEPPQRAPRQQALLARLQQQPAGISRAQARALGFSPATIKALVDRNLARWTQRPATAAAFSAGDDLMFAHRVHLNSEQQTAVHAIRGHASSTWLLHGITGSGKTEVYFRLINDVLAKGQQALVLVPEIGLTPQTIQRFEARFNAPMTVLHSGLSDKERLAGFRAAGNGSAAIVIGTRSAIFTPLRNPGLIVVDEEHDSSFKQQDGFRYSARDLAVMRGHLESVPVILGSATPSLESLHNARTGKYQLQTLTQRAGPAQPPRFEVIDVRQQPLQEGFSKALTTMIQAHLGRDEQVLVFLNRRGFAPALLCHECGWLANCRHCDARLTCHLPLRQLICHHCGDQQPLPNRCPACQSSQLVPLGSGTQRIEAALHAVFPDTPVVRVDRDTTRTRDAFNHLLEQIDTGQAAILVGTQLLAKGHHFPNVTLVAIIDMDAGFYSADFRAVERTGQLLLQVGGRAGRETRSGVVALQTHFPDQPILRLLINEGYTAFADQLLQEREAFELPPFHHHTLLRADAADKHLALDFLRQVQQQLPPRAHVTVLGPIPASMERRAGRFRAQLLFSSPSRRALHFAIDDCLQLIDNKTLPRQLRWGVEVDPVDLY